MISSRNINHDRIENLDNVRYLSKEIFEIENERTRLNVGDILFTSVGSLGRSCVYNSCYNLCFQRSVSIIHTLTYNYWVKYFFDSDYYQNLIIKKATGTAQMGFYLQQLSESYIALPPYNEQLRIVSEIEHWFALINDIETNKLELQEFIKQTKSKILDFAIHGKLVPQDPNDEPAIELLKRINPAIKPCDTSHYGNIPESWCIVRLGDIYNHTTGKALKKSNTYGVWRKYITTSNLYWNSFDLTEVRSMYFTVEEIEKCTVHKGDLLLCNGGDVGRAAIWNYDEDICIQNHISRLRPKYENTIDNLFYYYILMYLKQEGLLNGKGVAITSLSAADLLSIPVPLPPKKEQVRIVQKIQEIEIIINTIITDL
jgi:type I restriction enzyme S subunit